MFLVCELANLLMNNHMMYMSWLNNFSSTTHDSSKDQIACLCQLVSPYGVFSRVA
jgi:hypothetical protein